MNALLGTLGFLLVFHLIGGAVLGGTVRQWLRGRFACNSLFSALWGGLFGLLPLVIGVTTFGAHGDFLYIGIEIGAFIGVILLAALTPDWFLQSFDLPRIAPVAAGGLFSMIGLGIFVALLGTDPLVALVFLGAFGGGGVIAIVSGLRAMLKSKVL